jgi:hypothetical protein
VIADTSKPSTITGFLVQKFWLPSQRMSHDALTRGVRFTAPLQSAKTAREAIQIMMNLLDGYVTWLSWLLCAPLQKHRPDDACSFSCSPCLLKALKRYTPRMNILM